MRVCFEILWNSIESIGRMAIENIATEDIVFAMRELFLDIMKKGYKLEDKVAKIKKFSPKNTKIGKKLNFSKFVMKANQRLVPS